MASEQGAPAAATGDIAYPTGPGEPLTDPQAGAFRRNLRR